MTTQCLHICPVGDHDWNCMEGIEEETETMIQQMEKTSGTVNEEFIQMVREADKEIREEGCEYPERWLCVEHMRLFNATRSGASPEDRKWANEYLRKNRDNFVALRKEGMLKWQ